MGTSADAPEHRPRPDRAPRLDRTRPPAAGGARPPERFPLAGMSLRRWTPGDAVPLHRALVRSHAHLRPWMPWAADPFVLAGQREFVDRSIREWDTGEEFGYGIFDPAGGEVLGSIALHRRIGPYGLEIGYWVHAAHTGRGLATIGSALLTRAAFGLPGIDRVEIHCDEANAASAAVPRRLGFGLVRVQDDVRDTPGKVGRRMIWAVTRSGYPGGAAERGAGRAAPDPAD